MVHDQSEISPMLDIHQSDAGLFSLEIMVHDQSDELAQPKHTCSGLLS